MLSGVVFRAKLLRADWARLVVIDVIFEKGEGGKLVKGILDVPYVKY